MGPFSVLKSLTMMHRKARRHFRDSRQTFGNMSGEGVSEQAQDQEMTVEVKK